MLASLYVGRSFHLWKDPNLLPWLEKNVHKVLARVDAAGIGFSCLAIEQFFLFFSAINNFDSKKNL